ncbi:UPK3L protein, partial [Penelope pileata]|nr:UPK3L protein [Penelope pileata]
HSALSTGTMHPLLLLLLATAHGLVTVNYTPELASSELGGLVTARTFVLQQPRCVFEDPKYSTAKIWLVVATAKGKEDFNNTVEPGSPEWAFQRFPANASAYLTLGAAMFHYPCPVPTGEITVLRVGSETACADDVAVPTCNGPLPGPGPYWVKFLALNGSEPVADTEWFGPIKLKTARQLPSGPEAGGGRSGAMIAITSILSILLALLLATLLAALCGSELCGSGSFKPDSASIRRYTTHHVYDQPAARL